MGRAPCCDKANVKKGPWSPEEDSKLKDYIEKYGTGGNWIALPQKAGLKRCGKSCRLRWLNYLRPNIKHGEFSNEEDRIILTLFASIGSRWSIIAAHLPGRTDNDIKNYWNTKLKKKLMATVIPNPNHKIIKPSLSSQIFPPSYIYHQNSPLHLPSQPLSSSLVYTDDLCHHPSSNYIPITGPITKSSSFTGLDFSSSVPSMSLLTDSSHLTNPSTMFQTHESNVANQVDMQYNNRSQMMIKQERTDHIQGFVSNGCEESYHQAEWEEKRNDGFYGETQMISSSNCAIDYDLEEVKRLIGSSSSGSDSSSFLSSLY